MKRVVGGGIFLALITILVVFVLSAGSADRAVVSSRTVNLSYTVDVKHLPPGAKQVAIWIPVPESDSWQTVSDVTVKSEVPYSFHSDPEYGNNILHLAGGVDAGGRVSATMNVRVTRFGYTKLHGKADRWDSTSESMLKRFLQPDDLIPVDGAIAEEARNAVGAEASTLKKARLLYDHIVSSMTYDKTGTGWGKGDALFACDRRRGNCTDFHSLFIGLARASGIPSRFVMGFPMPAGKGGEVTGYHCWAEFHVEGMGWIPIDATEAKKNPAKEDFFFGGLDENRVRFTTGRDIPMGNVPGEKRLNYFIYPHVEVDGHKHEAVDFSLRFKEGSM